MLELCQEPPTRADFATGKDFRPHRHMVGCLAWALSNRHDPLGSALSLQIPHLVKVVLELVAQSTLKVNNSAAERVLNTRLEQLPKLFALARKLLVNFVRLRSHCCELLVDTDLWSLFHGLLCADAALLSSLVRRSSLYFGICLLLRRRALRPVRFDLFPREGPPIKCVQLLPRIRHAVIRVDSFLDAHALDVMACCARR
mmetsp:Transcript_83224/g.232104  ORF Transcript_83224/g.232104 Transcript_83224/m.232104 type:complete len:200 (-) Transcript_83224:56-655(-)